MDIQKSCASCEYLIRTVPSYSRVTFFVSSHNSVASKSRMVCMVSILVNEQDRDRASLIRASG